MRITGPQKSGGSVSSGSTRGVSGGATFSLPSASAASSAPATAGPRAMADVSSLLALQTIDAAEPAGARRGRMVRRGRRLLDVLDEMKMALLGDGVGGSLLANLESAIAEAREGTDDAGLDAVLDAVELRARVELAKLQALSRR